MGVGFIVGGFCPTTSLASASNNSLTGNTTYGIENVSSTTTVNGSANWWGSNSEATVASLALGTVDYTPWLDIGDDVSLEYGFQGSFSTLHVDDDSPQTGALTHIQEGINLVTASTVVIGPGTYPGNLVLSTSVILLGAQAGVDACGRVASESILTGTGVLLGSRPARPAPSSTASPSRRTRAIESTTSPIDNVNIQTTDRGLHQHWGVPGTDITVTEPDDSASNRRWRPSTRHGRFRRLPSRTTASRTGPEPGSSSMGTTTGVSAAAAAHGRTCSTTTTRSQPREPRLGVRHDQQQHVSNMIRRPSGIRTPRSPQHVRDQ
jgi:hypothetical protein